MEQDRLQKERTILAFVAGTATIADTRARFGIKAQVKTTLDISCTLKSMPSTSPDLLVHFIRFEGEKIKKIELYVFCFVSQCQK